MIYGPKTGGYPIVNYEYAIVSTKQPSAVDAQAVKAVLAWAIDPTGGGTLLSQVGFVALPTAVQSISAKLLSAVSS
jgi:phosphate transport system substrate-binding protein